MKYQVCVLSDNLQIFHRHRQFFILIREAERCISLENANVCWDTSLRRVLSAGQFHFVCRDISKRRISVYLQPKITCVSIGALIVIPIVWRTIMTMVTLNTAFTFVFLKEIHHNNHYCIALWTSVELSCILELQRIGMFSDIWVTIWRNAKGFGYNRSW